MLAALERGEVGMEPNSRLPYLETIHADLVQQVWALERLRKLVEQKEAALHAKIASQKQQRNMRRIRPVDTSRGQAGTLG